MDGFGQIYVTFQNIPFLHLANLNHPHFGLDNVFVINERRGAHSKAEEGKGKGHPIINCDGGGEEGKNAVKKLLGE